MTCKKQNSTLSAPCNGIQRVIVRVQGIAGEPGGLDSESLEKIEHAVTTSEVAKAEAGEAKVAAITAQDSAKNSAAEAAKSEGFAKTSAKLAGEAEGKAAASAKNAADSEAAAELSAKGSATAKGEAEAAATRAENAATLAEGKAGEASMSADDASAQAAASAVSAESARQSAAEAEASAASAMTSKDDAAKSAMDAAGSATDAAASVVAASGQADRAKSNADLSEKAASRATTGAVNAGNSAAEANASLQTLLNQLKDYLPLSGGTVYGSLIIGKGLQVWSGRLEVLNGYFSNVIKGKGKDSASIEFISSDNPDNGKYGQIVITANVNAGTPDVTPLYLSAGRFDEFLHFGKNNIYVNNPKVLTSGVQNLSEGEQGQICSNIGVRRIHAQGGDSSGYWIQYEDGEMEVWGTVSKECSIDSPRGNVAMTGVFGDIVFPIPFVGNYVAFPFVMGASGSFVIIDGALFGYSSKLASVGLKRWSSQPYKTNVTVGYVAKGRWK